MEDKNWIAQQLLQHEALHKFIPLLDQFKIGFQKVKVLNIIQAFPDEFLPLFTFDGGIEAADVLKTLSVEDDCKDEETFRILNN